MAIRKKFPYFGWSEWYLVHLYRDNSYSEPGVESASVISVNRSNQSIIVRHIYDIPKQVALDTYKPYPRIKSVVDHIQK